MLDNRKIGELPEINGKLVKVSGEHKDVPGRDHPLQEGAVLGQLQALTASPLQSIFRVVFHDRRLQYTEHQQLEGWRWNRPGDRILDIGESPWQGQEEMEVPEVPPGGLLLLGG